MITMAVSKDCNYNDVKDIYNKFSLVLKDRVFLLFIDIELIFRNYKSILI